MSDEIYIEQRIKSGPRTLRTISGSPGKVLGFDSNSALTALDSGGGVSDGQQIFDGSHVLAFDSGDRKLYANDGTTEMVDWSAASNLHLLGVNGVSIFPDGGPTGDKIVIENEVGAFDTLVSYASDNVANIDLLNRKLYSDDGETVMVDWSGGGGDVLLEFFPDVDGSQSKYVKLFNNRVVFDVESGAGLGQAYLDEVYASSLRNYNGDENANIDLENRKLYNPDGTTVAIDYGTDGSVKLPNLPTSDPAVAGQLWNDSGTLKISAG